MATGVVADSDRANLGRATVLTRTCREPIMAPVTTSCLVRPERGRRWRRAVAWIAIAFWMARTLVCPVPDLDTDDPPSVETHQPAAPEHNENSAPAQHEADLCCQLLKDTSTIAKPTAWLPSLKAQLSLLPLALLLLTLSLPAPAGRRVKLVPFSNGPPRSPYQRFATFWAHAPPC